MGCVPSAVPDRSRCCRRWPSSPWVPGCCCSCTAVVPSACRPCCRCSSWWSAWPSCGGRSTTRRGSRGSRAPPVLGSCCASLPASPWSASASSTSSRRSGACPASATSASRCSSPSSASCCCSARGSSRSSPTSAASVASGSARRSVPTSPPTCTTRCCRPWRSCRRTRPTRPRSRPSPGARSASCGRGCTARRSCPATVVRAAREAVVNAAKHAGVDRVDVYAEVGRGVVEVYVRDRGTGFDPDAIADDRMGVRGSIIGRVENHGGTARVRSGVDGTEVALTMPLSAPPAAGPEEPR
ncbi:sensor histidine kinase [Aeromicrobium sp. REDSEA-S32_B7]|uniref:sensor histidine kinase n=1 Tax=Aeromicrobium sp. REDSEA-S32_B7 TaxID=1811526 RepID=UPI0034DB24E2